MKKIIALILAGITASAVMAVSPSTPRVDYVDPFIGTGAVAGGLSGNNYPGATVPFGMVQLCPDTHEAPDWYNASGYNYKDSTIYGFSHTRLSGTGASDLIDLLVFPKSRNVSSFSHSQESARPGYYAVDLLDEGVKAELTAGKRSGYHRYTYPDGDRNLWIDLDHSANKGSWGRRIINSQIRRAGANALEGYRIITGWAKLRKIYFYMEFSEPIAGLVLMDGDKRYDNTTDVVNGTALKAFVSFGKESKPLECRVGISPVSIDNARENLAADFRGMSFDALAKSAADEWEKLLSLIEVDGSPEQMKTFYTALYHTMCQPNLFSDFNGRYIGADYSEKQLKAGENQYTTFSLWDTYRAAHPLYTILLPELTADFVNSMLRHYDDYGYLPIWHLWGQDNYCMIGNHSIPVIADAVLKDIPGIDTEKAYQAVKESSTNAHPNSPFDIWEKYGYMPEDEQTQSVSITLEMAFDDWCVAQLAKKLGKTDDYDHFMKRAGNFRNLYDTESGFFAPKDSGGKLIRPFDPLKYGANGGYPFTEGNAWQYFWYVPHDVEGLISLSGGKKAFAEKLDKFFTLTDQSGELNDNISGMIGQYAHGNEPSHHAAYLYNYAGVPHKTQDMVWRIMNELYDNTSAGYSGNDDCGEMSAWYVFSAMGFYPVNPASGEYDLGTPLFDKATINLQSGKKFVVKAKRSKAGAHRVKEVKLNGKPLKTGKISNTDILAGGELEFTLQH